MRPVLLNAIQVVAPASNKEREMFSFEKGSQRAMPGAAPRLRIRVTRLPLCVWFPLWSCTNLQKNVVNEPYFQAKLFKSFLLLSCLGAKMPLIFKGFPNSTWLGFGSGTAAPASVSHFRCFRSWLSDATGFYTVLLVLVYEVLAPIDFSFEPFANKWIGDKDRQNAPSPDLIVTARTGRGGQSSKTPVSAPLCDN